jgi:hypothetical protein
VLKTDFYYYNRFIGAKLAHYQQGKGVSRHRYRLWLAVVALFAVGLSFYWFRLHKQPLKTDSSQLTVAGVAASPPQNFTSLVGRYLFNGTTVWARAVEQDSQRKDGSYDYAHPFSQLNTFNRAAYDAWATDFECPITNNNVPFATQVSQLIFNCRPEFLPEAAKYFNLFDLANNHTDNQGGAVGLDSTRKYMDKIPGVQYFGSFDPSVANDVCEVVALPARLQKPDKSEEKSALPVAMCAWHYFYRKPLAGEIAVMDRYAKIMPVMAFVKMGVEYHPTADAVQQEIAHQVIDHGPEFLIANNPHWVQNTEVYKNKLIVYSTGNFIFDQLDNETQRSASIDVTMHLAYDDNVAAWVKLAPSCLAFQDQCLDMAQQLGLRKVQPQLRYAVVAGQGGDRKLTHKADAATQAAVEQRLNWVASMKALNQ